MVFFPYYPYFGYSLQRSLKKAGELTYSIEPCYMDKGNDEENKRIIEKTRTMISYPKKLI